MFGRSTWKTESTKCAAFPATAGIRIGFRCAIGWLAGDGILERQKISGCRRHTRFNRTDSKLRAATVADHCRRAASSRFELPAALAYAALKNKGNGESQSLSLSN